MAQGSCGGGRSHDDVKRSGLMKCCDVRGVNASDNFAEKNQPATRQRNP